MYLEGFIDSFVLSLITPYWPDKILYYWVIDIVLYTFKEMKDDPQHDVLRAQKRFEITDFHVTLKYFTVPTSLPKCFT